MLYIENCYNIDWNFTYILWNEFDAFSMSERIKSLKFTVNYFLISQILNLRLIHNFHQKIKWELFRRIFLSLLFLSNVDAFRFKTKPKSAFFDSMWVMLNLCLLMFLQSKFLCADVSKFHCSNTYIF